MRVATIVDDDWGMTIGELIAKDDNGDTIKHVICDKSDSM